MSVVIKDSTGKEVTGLDKSRVTHYTIEVVVTDAEGNSTTVHLRYQLYEEGTTPPAPGGSGERATPKLRCKRHTGSRQTKAPRVRTERGALVLRLGK